MNKLLRRLPLRIKLLSIGILPFCFLLYVTLDLYEARSEKIALFEGYRQYLGESNDIIELIHSLQEERKYSFDYTITRSAREKLTLQRPITDSLIARLKSGGNIGLAGFSSYTNLDALAEVRKRVDSFTISPDDVMRIYTTAGFRLNTLSTLPPANTAYLEPVYHDLMAQKTVMEMLAYLQIIRSNFYNVLHTKKYMTETLFGTYGSYQVYKSYETEFRVKADPQTNKTYEKLAASGALHPTITYIDAVFKTFKFDDTYTAGGWWTLSEKGTDELRNLQRNLQQSISGKINMLYESEIESRNMALALLALSLLGILAIVIYVSVSINSSLCRLRAAAEAIASGKTGIRIHPQSDAVIESLSDSIRHIDDNNRNMAVAAEALGKGNFDVNIEPRSPEDILGNALVKMRGELRDYHTHMDDLVANRTEELARSNEDLRQFAHVASHDLKEPLRKIAVFSKMISEHEHQLPEKARLYLRKINTSAERMSRMIDDILAYSTVTANSPEPELVNLKAIIEDVENDLELAIIQKEARLLYHELPHIKGIRRQLHQLFYNLVNNALKFARQGIPPVITVRMANGVEKTRAESLVASQPGSFAHLVVEDNGIGFNPDYAERIFGVFTRLHAKDDYEGSGIGLALCRKIARRHEGFIFAESEENVGTRFHLLLPVS